jgi:hypothetical protein
MREQTSGPQLVDRVVAGVKGGVCLLMVKMGCGLLGGSGRGFEDTKIDEREAAQSNDLSISASTRSHPHKGMRANARCLTSLPESG